MSSEQTGTLKISHHSPHHRYHPASATEGGSRALRNGIAALKSAVSSRTSDVQQLFESVQATHDKEFPGEPITDCLDLQLLLDVVDQTRTRDPPSALGRDGRSKTPAQPFDLSWRQFNLLFDGCDSARLKSKLLAIAKKSPIHVAYPALLEARRQRRAGEGYSRGSDRSMFWQPKDAVVAMEQLESPAVTAMTPVTKRKATSLSRQDDKKVRYSTPHSRTSLAGSDYQSDNEDLEATLVGGHGFEEVTELPKPSFTPGVVRNWQLTPDPALFKFTSPDSALSKFAPTTLGSGTPASVTLEGKDEPSVPDLVEPVPTSVSTSRAQDSSIKDLPSKTAARDREQSDTAVERPREELLAANLSLDEKLHTQGSGRDDQNEEVEEMLSMLRHVPKRDESSNKPDPSQKPPTPSTPEHGLSAKPGHGISSFAIYDVLTTLNPDPAVYRICLDISSNDAKQQTRKSFPPSTRFFVLPLHHKITQPYHWTVAFGDIETAEVEHYDPLHQECFRQSAYETLSTFASALDSSRLWKIVDSKYPCRQITSMDCGIFVLAYAICKLSHQEYPEAIEVDTLRHLLSNLLSDKPTPLKIPDRHRLPLTFQIPVGDLDAVTSVLVPKHKAALTQLRDEAHRLRQMHLEVVRLCDVVDGFLRAFESIPQRMQLHKSELHLYDEKEIGKYKNDTVMFQHMTASRETATAHMAQVEMQSQHADKHRRTLEKFRDNLKSYKEVLCDRINQTTSEYSRRLQDVRNLAQRLNDLANGN